MAQTKEKDKTLATIISVSVLIILSVAFLTSLVTQTSVNTEKTVVSDEAIALEDTGNSTINTTAVYTVTNYPTSWKIEDCPLTLVYIKNQSGTALTETTDYVFNYSYGTFTLKDTEAAEGLVGVFNNSYVTYSYCGDGYVSQSWGRTVLNTTLGLLAIAILAVGVYFVYSLYKTEEE